MIGIMPTLCSWYAPESATYREILLPFVDVYWTTALRDRKWLFPYGAAVEGQLSQAKTVPERQRVAAIFRAVRCGFRFRGEMPPTIRCWLYEDQPVSA